MRFYNWSPGDTPQPTTAPAPAAPHGDPHPSLYVPHPDLVKAVNVALLLGKPLLLTGDPGVGKTELGASIAWRLGLSGPFKFTAKSTSESRDLFYRYDALGRFQALELQRAGAAEVTAEQTEARNFIEYVALGRAILLAQPHSPELAVFMPPARNGRADEERHDDRAAFSHPGRPQRSVVVIDEIDKASRDFMNDLLEELEFMTFQAPELVRAGVKSPAIEDRAYWPVVIITSNSERSFPEPFLRRCLYFHIPSPARRANPSDPASRYYNIENIVALRLSQRQEDFVAQPLIQSALDAFADLRACGLSKAPATSELLNWIATLRAAQAQFGVSGDHAANAELMIETAMLTLLKTEEDQSLGRPIIAKHFVGK